VTFLKKLGGILVKGIAVAVGFAPMIQQFVPGSTGIVQTVSKDLAQIADIIVQAEAMGQALGQPGPQKLIAVTPMVAQIILGSSMLSGHKIANSDLFKQGCTSIASGMADVLNSLKDDVATEDKT
jgi:hypothetical protein